MSPFIPLEVHSHYSFLRGTASVATLAARARVLGYDRLALTDTGGLHGLPEFIAAAAAAGVTPIAGAKLGHLLLLVQREPGFANLTRLVSRHHLAPTGNWLAGLPGDACDGLAVVTDGTNLERELPQLAGAASVWLGVGGAADARRQLALARAAGVPPVYVPPVWFAHRDEYHRHRLVTAIRLGKTLATLADADGEPPGAYLRPAAEYGQFAALAPETVANAIALARGISFVPRHRAAPLLPAGSDADRARLRARVEAGARRRYPELTAAVRARLDYELAVIAGAGFVTFFLIADEITRYGSRTCGRGSGAASLVSYCLGITAVDPIKHRLKFERFLHPERRDPPDLDIDFPWDERDGIWERVTARFGDANLARVAAILCLREDACLREAARLHGLAGDEITRVRDLLRRRQLSERSAELDPLWSRVFLDAARLDGVPRGTATHCGGVVITDGAIAAHAPLERAAGGYPLLQWDKDGCEAMGLVKLDLLGNRSLAVIRDALANIRAHGLEPPDFLRHHPEDDPATQALFAAGKTMGVFYLESPPMRLLQEKAGRGDYESIVIHSSLIRPAAHPHINAYLRRLHGEPWVPLHPVFTRLLSATHGILCYQEDVMLVAQAVAGFSDREANDLRKTLSKKSAQRLADFKALFLTRAGAGGMDPATREQIWAMIESFAGYSFCKPHSASYARVSFEAGYLKAHFPAEFLAAVISNFGGFYTRQAYLSECRRLGLAILPPDLAASEIKARGSGTAIRLGFDLVANLSRAMLERLLAERAARPFPDFPDFLRRVRPARDEAAQLIRAGAFDAWVAPARRPALFWQLAQHHAGGDAPPVDPQRFEPLPAAALLAHEESAFGFSLRHHPVALARERGPELARGTIPVARLRRHLGQRVTLLGLPVTGRTVWTKDEREMAFWSFEDETEIFEATIFPDRYDAFIRELVADRVYLVTGKAVAEFGAVTVELERVREVPAGAPRCAAS